MSAITRRRRHKDELTVEMLEAARDIFVREGYESFSMRRLAQRIEYSPASIYLHFKNKDELFRRLVEDSFAGLYRALAALRGDDPVALLKKGLWTYVRFGLRHRNDYRFAFLLQPPVTTRPYKPHAAFEVLRGLVQRGVEQGRFRRAEAETTSQALWAAVHGITSLLIQRPTFPWVARDKLIAQVIDSAVDSLLSGNPGRNGGRRRNGNRNR